MPEEGDPVGLHFPGEQKKDAYIISTVHPADHNEEACPCCIS